MKCSGGVVRRVRERKCCIPEDLKPSEWGGGQFRDGRGLSWVTAPVVEEQRMCALMCVSVCL